MLVFLQQSAKRFYVYLSIYFEKKQIYRKLYIKYVFLNIVKHFSCTCSLERLFWEKIYTTLISLKTMMQGRIHYFFLNILRSTFMNAQEVLFYQIKEGFFMFDSFFIIIFFHKIT